MGIQRGPLRRYGSFWCLTNPDLRFSGGKFARTVFCFFTEHFAAVAEKTLAQSRGKRWQGFECTWALHTFSATAKKQLTTMSRGGGRGGGKRKIVPAARRRGVYTCVKRRQGRRGDFRRWKKKSWRGDAPEKILRIVEAKARPISFVAISAKEQIQGQDNAPR